MSDFYVYVTARASSRRLPLKALLPIEGQSVFEHIVDRARQVRSVMGVVVCTSTDPRDDEIERLARAKGVEVYRGALEEKFERWLGAADAHHVDYFINYDGDDVFCDPDLMDLAAAQMRAEPCDFLNLPRGLVVGGGAVCVSVESLRRVAALAPKGIDDTWPFFTETGLYHVRDIRIADRVFFTDNIRLTLDYEEDLRFFRTVFRELHIEQNTTPLRDIVMFLKKRPDITTINWFRQEDYLENRKHLPGLSRRRP